MDQPSTNNIINHDLIITTDPTDPARTLAQAAEATRSALSTASVAQASVDVEAAPWYSPSSIQ